LRSIGADGIVAAMTAILTLDEAGRLVLPEDALRVLGMKPGEELRADVTRGRIELLDDEPDDVPVITELSPEGLPVIPASVRKISSVDVVAAIKADREERIRKLSGG
jgi:bifunctional DNA-binding transcriptional regulator/antitoxin component of YhaV-PrlF toxin-antitoxin module